MAAGRRPNSHESPHGADFDVDENWHVDFGHAGVRQMSVRQIAEAWQAGAMLESTLVWHEGLADWEEVLAVPQIARAIDALAAAAPPQAASYYQGSDDLDDATSDWEATVVETTSSRSGEAGRARAIAQSSAASQRSLPPPPNARSVGAKASSSLPPPPDAKAAFETQVWAHSTPPPPELPFARDAYSRHERAVEALRFPRPSSRETPEAPTAKAPPVTSLPRRERASSAGLPARPNPSSMAPHSENAPLSVVRVGGTSKPALPTSEAAELSPRRLLIWGSLGGAALGAVLLLLWRLIAPSHASDQNSLNSESIEQTSETTAESDEAVVAAPVRNEEAKAEQAPAPPVVEAPVAAQAASAPTPEAPVNLPTPSNDSQPTSSAPALAAPSKAEAIQATGTPTKSETIRNEEAKRAQNVVAAPSIKSEAPPAQKEKAPSSAAPTPPVDKQPPAAPSARVVEEEPPAKAPAAPSAPDPAFNKEAAVATLNTAAAAAGRCPGSDARGPGTARVVFSLDGTVRSVSIVSGDFEATAAGTCVMRAFQRCKVPPFSGKPAAVSKQFVVK